METVTETATSSRKSKVAPVMERMCGMSCGVHHKKWFLAVIVMLLIAFGLSHWFGIFSGIDRSSYQAVFLTNGQVYFGKLRMSGMGFLMLKEAHYLQVATTPETKGVVPPVSLNLVNIEKQPQGPLGDIYIPKNQIIFWENLRPDSEAVKVIEQQKAAGQ